MSDWDLNAKVKISALTLPEKRWLASVYEIHRAVAFGLFIVYLVAEIGKAWPLRPISPSIRGMQPFDWYTRTRGFGADARKGVVAGWDASIWCCEFYKYPDLQRISGQLGDLFLNSVSELMGVNVFVRRYLVA